MAREDRLVAGTPVTVQGVILGALPYPGEPSPDDPTHASEHWAYVVHLDPNPRVADGRGQDVVVPEGAVAEAEIAVAKRLREVQNVSPGGDRVSDRKYRNHRQAWGICWGRWGVRYYVRRWRWAGALRTLWLTLVVGYISETCQECGKRYLLWMAPGELYERVIGSRGGLFCPRCFDHKARAIGDTVCWTPMVVRDDDGEYWTEVDERIGAFCR